MPVSAAPANVNRTIAPNPQSGCSSSTRSQTTHPTTDTPSSAYAALRHASPSGGKGVVSTVTVMAAITDPQMAMRVDRGISITALMAPHS